MLLTHYLYAFAKRPVPVKLVTVSGARSKGITLEPCLPGSAVSARRWVRFHSSPNPHSSLGSFRKAQPKVGGGDTGAAFCSWQSNVGFIIWSRPTLGDSNLVAQGRKSSMGNHDIWLQLRTSRSGQSDGGQSDWLMEKGKGCLAPIIMAWWWWWRW